MYPGAQMHMYVPIRFLQVIPLLEQSSIPSSHSFWSGKSDNKLNQKKKQSVFIGTLSVALLRYSSTYSNSEVFCIGRHEVADLTICLKFYSKQ